MAFSRGTAHAQICCCSPYSALVSTSPNPDTCECTTRAGWALILLAVLVPILIIGDIMLTVYCCYKGRCCCFKPANTENSAALPLHACNSKLPLT